MSDRETGRKHGIGSDTGTSRASGNWFARHDLLLYVLAAGAAALAVATGAPAPNLEAYTDWLGIGAALPSTIIAVIVTLLGGAEQLTTSIPRRSTART